MVSEDTAIPDNQAGVLKQHLVLRLRPQITPAAMQMPKNQAWLLINTR